MTWEEDNGWGENGGGDVADEGGWDGGSVNVGGENNGYAPSGVNGGGDKGCRTCGREGHFARECPDKPSRACFKCGDEGHMSRECPQNSAPRTCRKCNEEGHIAKDCPNAPPMTCRKCNEEGHMSRECPNPSSITCRKCNEEGHISRECPNAPPMACRRCKEEGHIARDCPLGPDDRGCFNCHQPGHLSRDCPEGPRERGPMKCHNCQQEGHKADECTNEAVQRLDENGEPLPAAISYIPTTTGIDSAFCELSYTGANVSRFETDQVTVSDPQFQQPIACFEDANLCDILIEKLTGKLGFVAPTPIQKFCIPIVLAGKDMIACSQTGSGKSAAFILPILHQLLQDSELQPRSEIAGKSTQTPLVVVLSPTRELCSQLYKHFRVFSEENPRRIGVSSAYGGTQVRYNRSELRSGTHVLCAVPGRLKQFVEDGTVSFSNLRYLVLDEADRMLDQGFWNDIDFFAKHSSMPSKDKRQTIMLSATFPPQVKELARTMMRPSETIEVIVGILGGVNSDVAQTFTVTDDYKSKRAKLLEILGAFPSCKVPGVNPNRERIIVFVEYKKSADVLGMCLCQLGYSSTTMHGSRDQQQREEALRTFREGEHGILVATAVASRGLDIKGVSLVVNFDLPKEIDDYVHRVGRTGRVGIPGRAISFFSPSENSALACHLVKVLNESNQPVPDCISSAASGGFDNVFDTEDPTSVDADEDNGWA